jgi:predicted permease
MSYYCFKSFVAGYTNRCALSKRWQSYAAVTSSEIVFRIRNRRSAFLLKELRFLCKDVE